MHGLYLYRRLGRDVRFLELHQDGTIGVGQDICERTWDLSQGQLRLFGDLGLTTRLTQGQGGFWSGFCRVRELIPLELIPYWAGHTGAGTHRGVYVRDQVDISIVEEIEQTYGYQLGLRWAPEKPVILDVGAHIGAFTIYAKRIRPEAHVIAVEPNPANLHYCRMNCASLANVHCEEGFVYYGGRPKYIQISHAQMYIVTPEGSDPVSPVWTLDKLAEHYGFSDVHFLKLDCEGSEFNILEHGAIWIKDHVHLIGGEYHLGYPYSRPWEPFVDAYYGDWLQVRIPNLHNSELGYFLLINPKSEYAKYL